MLRNTIDSEASARTAAQNADEQDVSIRLTCKRSSCLRISAMLSIDCDTQTLYGDVTETYCDSHRASATAASGLLESRSGERKSRKRKRNEASSTAVMLGKREIQQRLMPGPARQVMRRLIGEALDQDLSRHTQLKICRSGLAEKRAVLGGVDHPCQV